VTAARATTSPPAPPSEGRDDAQPPAVVRVGLRLVSPALTFIEAFGEHMILLGRSFAWLFRRPFRPKLFFEQMEFVGVGSLPIIILVGFFAGAVSALQAVLALRMFSQERWVGFGVGISLARELAPVFSALMITARAGSANE